MIYDCIIVGGGVSGLMAAVQLEKQNVNYMLLEKNSTVGKKLLITGSARCNVTNNLDVETFINQLTITNKRFLYSALYKFGPDEVIEYFNKNDVELVLENNFKYFPKSNKSKSILDALLANIAQKRIKVNSPVNKIKKNGELFEVDVRNDVLKAKTVIISTGSKSFPITGSTGDGLVFAKGFDIKYNSFSPAETHVFSKEVIKRFSDLQGTAIKNAVVKIANTKLENTGDLLFTHFGLSGPAIYHLSEFIYSELVKGPVKLNINIIGIEKDELLSEFSKDRKANLFISKTLNKYLSKRLTKKVLEENNQRNISLNEISTKILKKIADYTCSLEIIVDRVEAKEKAYVNKGGVLLNELNPQTMESKKVNGLFFVGETVDIHGPIGGFNITIAFATAKLAAIKIIAEYK